MMVSLLLPEWRWIAEVFNRGIEADIKDVATVFITPTITGFGEALRNQIPVNGFTSKTHRE